MELAPASSDFTQASGPSPHALRLGIDLGGTKTEVAVLGPDGQFLLRERAPTPRSDYRATIATIGTLVAQAERAVGAKCTVGVGIPGTVSPATGTVKNANSVWLNGQPLLQDLEAALERPVRIQNDANCLAVSEGADGAGANAHCVIALVLGTGVGAGICIGKSVLVGRNAIAGEWGHNPLPPSFEGPTKRSGEGPREGSLDTPPRRCWCGRIDCIEAWLSGPALAAEFAREHPGHASGSVDAHGIFRLAEAGDAAALDSVDRWLDRLSRSLGTVINLLDPDAIVVGGGLSNAGVIYRELPRRWAAHVFSDRVDTVIVPAAHGDSSGVRGAAWLWP